MTIDEWSCRWKQNDRFPECLACGSESTKEHHFMQTWCRSKKAFESETLCLDCHMFSWRSYSDPDFLTPEEYDKIRWENMVNDKAAGRPVVPDADPGPRLRSSASPPTRTSDNTEAGNRGDAALESSLVSIFPVDRTSCTNKGHLRQAGHPRLDARPGRVKRNLRGPFFQAPLRRNQPQRCNT